MSQRLHDGAVSLHVQHMTSCVMSCRSITNTIASVLLSLHTHLHVSQILAETSAHTEPSALYIHLLSSCAILATDAVRFGVRCLPSRSSAFCCAQGHENEVFRVGGSLASYFKVSINCRQLCALC